MKKYIIVRSDNKNCSIAAISASLHPMAPAFNVVASGLSEHNARTIVALLNSEDEREKVINPAEDPLGAQK